LKDSDKDYLLDKKEIFVHNTDPNNFDSDGDGVSDGDEVNKYKTNPLDPESLPTIEEPPIPPVQEESEFIILKGIVFETDKADITPESEQILGGVLNTLNSNPELKIDILGYTDNIGDFNYNLKLSQKRADAVRLWLVRKGIDALRINSKGFGELNPIADNKTEEGKILNRRIEIVEIRPKK